ncbi:monofunctional biosynthetic peptidoglycan transglycosylase [Desulfovibrio sp.]
MRRVLGWIFKALAALAAYVLLVAAWYALVPDVKGLAKANPGKTAFMLYREDQWAREGRKTALKWKWAPLSSMSPALVKAVLISEDDKFWGHEGFDFDAMREALRKDVEEGRLRAGGSTISQQLAKNLWLSPSKSPMRKIKEAVLAWRLERELSKKRILEIYLNVVEWGDGIFGAEAASRAHFGVSASGLSAEQAVRLAVSLPNPLRYDPAGNSGFVRKRAAIILSRLQRRGYQPPPSPPPSADSRKAEEEGAGKAAPVPSAPPAAEAERDRQEDAVVREALDWVRQNVEQGGEAPAGE